MAWSQMSMRADPSCTHALGPAVKIRDLMDLIRSIGVAMTVQGDPRRNRKHNVLGRSKSPPPPRHGAFVASAMSPPSTRGTGGVMRLSLGPLVGLPTL